MDCGGASAKCQPGYWSPQANHNPAISSVPLGTENLKASRQIKSLDNSDTLNMFNNNTYTNFKAAHKHMSILDHKFK